MKKFLTQQREGWKHSISDYIPHRVFSSDRISINCLSGGVAVNFRDGDSADWVEIERDTNQSCP